VTDDAEGRWAGRNTRKDALRSRIWDALVAQGFAPEFCGRRRGRAPALDAARLDQRTRGEMQSRPAADPRAAARPL
jgi:hypothetical protein